MLGLCDTATDALREHCRGVSWELGIACMAALRALEEMGKLSEMRRRADQLVHEAEQKGDVYGMVEGFLFGALHRLAMCDPAGASTLKQRIVQLWSASGFHMQHFYAFRLESYADLSRSEPGKAWRRLHTTWPQLRRSNLLRHALIRSDAHLLRARVALAAALCSGGDAERMLHSADADALRLAREGRPDTDAHALFVRGASAAVRGNRVSAVDFLTQAAKGFEAAGMDLCLALTRRRMGELIGPKTGRDLLVQADEFFCREAISDPQGLLAMYAPGFDGRGYGRPYPRRPENREATSKRIL